jgi:superfamily II DNA helicase RecQ
VVINRLVKSQMKKKETNLEKPAVTLIISPLKALMADQLSRFEEHGFKALILTKDLQITKECDIVLVTPEFITQSKEAMAQLEWIDVLNIVVDECHLVISWGNEFRPAFLKFSSILKQRFPNAPIIAMTATANAMSLTEISVQLQLRHYVVLKSAINRSNLIINIKETNGSFDELYNLYTTFKSNRKTIIFCRTKETVDSVVAYLKTIEITAIYQYYSNLKADMNQPNWSEFIEAQSGTMVCTCGFGTGF